MSTNVSSPIQAASSRKRVAQRNIHETKNELHANGYYRDSFVVGDDTYDNDDEDDEDYGDDFEPVRVAGSSRKNKKRELGPPITVDQKMAELDDIHQGVVQQFLENAKELGKEILLKRNLREPPFTDTVLREMAIDFPPNLDRMHQIPGIKPEMVRLYGNRFLKLIKEAHEFYQGAMNTHVNERINQRRKDRDHDPNHENVINLISEDEAEDDEYGDVDFDEDSDEGEQSGYFSSGVKDAEVEAFNARFSQTQASKAMAPPPVPKLRASASSSDARPRPAGESKGRYSKGGFRKRSGGYSRGKSTGGVSKKGTARKRSSSYSNGSFGGSKRGGGFGGGGGIGMMPV